MTGICSIFFTSGVTVWSGDSIFCGGIFLTDLEVLGFCLAWLEFFTVIGGFFIVAGGFVLVLEGWVGEGTFFT